MRMKETDRIRGTKRYLVLYLDALITEGIRCLYCGRETWKPQIDHIVPRAKGGGNDTGNLVTSCLSCNQAKGDGEIPETLGKQALENLERHLETRNQISEDVYLGYARAIVRATTTTATRLDNLLDALAGLLPLA